MTGNLPALSAAQKNALQALAAATRYATRLDVFDTPANVLAEGGSDLFFTVLNLLAEQFFDGDDGRGFERALEQAGIDRSRLSALNDLHQTLNIADTMAALALGFAWGRLASRGSR